MTENAEDFLNLRRCYDMKGFRLHIIATIIPLLLLAGGAQDCHAQRKTRKAVPVGAQAVWGEKKTDSDDDNTLRYIVDGNDTIYVDHIRASKVYSRLPRQKGKEWRKYYKLVHNFSKAYPYALVARKLVHEADSTIAADNLKWAKRDKYVNKIQKELFEVFESQMRKMTVSQGALMMKLIDREVGKSSYSIIKDYKNGIAAGFWQGIAKMFGTDMKKPYDPEGEDKLTEELVKIWEAGEFSSLYWSLFWQDPPEMPIPEKYR